MVDMRQFHHQIPAIMGHMHWVGTSKYTPFTVDRTLIDIDARLWNILDAYEASLTRRIEGGDESLLNIRGYKVYVQQARSYYYAAKSATNNIAPLLYYYCLVNLAKAGLVAHELTDAYKEKRPYLDDLQKIRHGLSRADTNPSGKEGWDRLKEEKILIHGADKGATSLFHRFHEFYRRRIYYGLGAIRENNKKLKVEAHVPLAYIQTIKTSSRASDPSLLFKSLKADVRILTDEAESQFWGIVRMVVDSHYEDFSQYQADFKEFHDGYEKIRPSAQQIKALYGGEGGEWNASAIERHCYYQQKSPIIALPSAHYEEVPIQLIDTLRGRIQLNYMNMGAFAVCLPHEKSYDKWLHFNETIAIYTFMFYLGSLVRYEPRFLAGLFNDPRARALLDDFMQSAPATILHDLTCWITKTNHIILRPG